MKAHAGRMPDSYRTQSVLSDYSHSPTDSFEREAYRDVGISAPGEYFFVVCLS